MKESIARLDRMTEKEYKYKNSTFIYTLMFKLLGIYLELLITWFESLWLSI
jgi:hypothetical protein